MTPDQLKIKIAEIMRDNITFAPQVDDYIIHGAIEKIIELFEHPKNEALKLRSEYNDNGFYELWDDSKEIPECLAFSYGERDVFSPIVKKLTPEKVAIKTAEEKTLHQIAWQQWEEDQMTNPNAVNPHAFVYGFIFGYNHKATEPQHPSTTDQPAQE